MTLFDASRRHILKVSGALGMLGAAAPLGLQLNTMGSAAAQQATDYRALVCIFLFGGNDSHNTLLATDQDSWGRYWAARNTGSDPIALMPPGTAPVAAGQTSSLTGRVSQRTTPEFHGGVLPIVPRTANPIPAGTNAATRTFGLHPVLAPLMPIWEAGRLAAVANVGPLIVPTTKAQYQARSVRLPSGLMSHNDQQSQWQAGASEGARRGWGGLMADTMLASNGTNSLFSAVSVAGNAVFLAGQNAVQYQMTTNATPAVRITAATGTTLNGSATAAARLRDVIRDGSSPGAFGADYATVTRRSMDFADTLNTAFATGSASNIPAPPAFTNPVTGNVEANTLATQLQAVARGIAANSVLGLRRQVYFVSLGGWDNHDVQNTAQPGLLARVAHAMAYFDATLANIGGQNLRNQVTTFTMSDFSRTFTTNGDGTDHAWGGHYFVMGGAVRGQDIYGQYPTLGVDQGNFRNPDMDRNIVIPTTSVDQVAGTLGSWFGVTDAQLDTIFPNLRNFSRRNLGFMG